MSEAMTPTSAPVIAAQTLTNPKPVPFQFFLVQGVNFRCIAYCDPQGMWRDALNQEELFGEIRILSWP